MKTENTTINQASNNAALIQHLSELHPQLQQVREVTFEGVTVPFIVTTEGECESLAALVDDYRDKPRRRQGKATFTLQDSFNEHVQRFKGPASTLWGDRSNRNEPRLISVLDYHEAGADGAPAFGSHRGVYLFPLSDEWRAWTSGNRKAMGQKDFAEFIEDRMPDVVSANSLSGPDDAETLANIEQLELTLGAGAELLKLSRGLKVNVTHEVTDSVQLSSGESELQFKVSHSDRLGGKLKVPSGFVLRIPVFQGGDAVSLLALLRYSVEGGGKVSWTYSLYRAAQAFDAAFEEACLASQVATSIPLFFGTPEA